MPKKPHDAATLDFIHAMGSLIRRFRSAAASHELSMTESAVMRRLDVDGPATTADLARAESVKPQSKGAAVRESAKDAKRTWLAQAIAQLDEADRKTLYKAGEIIQRLAEK